MVCSCIAFIHRRFGGTWQLTDWTRWRPWHSCHWYLCSKVRQEEARVSRHDAVLMVAQPRAGGINVSLALVIQMIERLEHTLAREKRHFHLATATEHGQHSTEKREMKLGYCTAQQHTHMWSLTSITLEATPPSLARCHVTDWAAPR